MKKLNCILLIEDDPITLFLNKRMLEKLDVAEIILTAANGEEGLRKIQEQYFIHNKPFPEIIFVDLNMPVMDGFDFIKEFNKMKITGKEKTRIAVLTTSSDQTDLIEIFDLGVKSYVAKPLTEDSVLELINKI